MEEYMISWKYVITMNLTEASIVKITVQGCNQIEHARPSSSAWWRKPSLSKPNRANRTEQTEPNRANRPEQTQPSSTPAEPSPSEPSAWFSGFDSRPEFITLVCCI